MNKLTGTKITDEAEHIRQSVADILLTQIGSRVQRREYGSYIPLLIDRPINPVLLLQLSGAAVMALKKWEPRLQVTAFKPKVSEGAITATLIAHQTNTNKNFTFDDLLLGNKK
ncbi:GPW/gp25 family protein [Aggregatibacter actinomycetemcomitans]|uniref:GPW/gp25 family protein n=1 Tax=Aggregatibacter actinomycetemcomitans TaxID=714 RepID=UPI00197BCAC5|nr:GPW/gp25 family protein [Aggregatibacter actinomycetemcomitans]MBN6079898.1 GPW/gp25 family protein [Aggregatibacter actinomycetemcomitans]